MYVYTYAPHTCVDICRCTYICRYIYTCVHIYTCVCIYVCIHVYIDIYSFMNIIINTCVYTYRDINFSRTPFRTLTFTLSLSISLSLSSTFVLCFTLSLFLAPFTHARHNTTLTRATNSSHAPCAHYQWREKPTPRVRRGFESQGRHVSHLAHNVRSCNGHIWSHLLAESKSERARIRSASFAS